MADSNGFRSLASRDDLEKGKDGIEMAVREISQEDRDSKNPEAVQWQPGVRARFPWIGFGALFVMMVCIALSGVVLGTSRNRTRFEWPSYEQWGWVGNSYKEKGQIEPHVLLAIINTVTNVSLAIAIGQGVAIAWWRRAMAGSTVEDLHRSWGFASSILELLTAGRKFNLIALAALTAKLALIDNVLLQNAAGTLPGVYTKNLTEVSLPIAKVLPEDYAGIVSHDGSTISASYAFGSDIASYLQSNLIDPIEIYTDPTAADGYTYGYQTKCDGLCLADMAGFGFRWDCSASESSDEYAVTPELAVQNSQSTISDEIRAANNVTGGSLNPALFSTPLQKNPLLSVRPVFIPPGVSAGDAMVDYSLPKSYVNRTLNTGSIGLSIRWASLTADPESSDGSNCHGKTAQRFCFLTPATVKYTLSISNVQPATKQASGAETLDSQQIGVRLFSKSQNDPNAPVSTDPSGLVDGQWSGYTVVGDAYLPYNSSKWDSNLQNIAAFVQQNFNAYVMMEYVGKTYAPNYAAGGTGTLFGQWWISYDPSSSCVLSVLEPTDQISQALNNLMVRASMRAATDWRYNDGKNPSYQNVDHGQIQHYVTSMQVNTIRYTTNWWYGGAALIVIFLCAICTLPSYYGFWELGRKVTLGPIEIANAFQAPVLDHPAVAAQGEVKQLVEEIGSRRIQYGEIEGQHRLGVAGPSEVRPPAGSPA